MCVARSIEWDMKKKVAGMFFEPRYQRAREHNIGMQAGSREECCIYKDGLAKGREPVR